MDFDITQTSTRVLLWGAVVLGAWTLQKLFFTKQQQQQLPLPPGPKGLPLLGNIRDLPPPGVPEWRHWIQHKDRYGPLSSVTALGTTMILIHDKDIALELMEKRSAKYSGRPFQRFAQETCGFGALPAFQQNGHKFRSQRRLMAAQMGSRSSMTKFQSAIEFQVRHFLLNAMNNPEDLEQHLQRESGSLMLETLYGYTATAKGRDPLVDLINKFMAAFSDAAVPGAWLVDVIPWLRHVPEWLPGAGFQKTAREYRKLWDNVRGVPFSFAEEQIKTGNAKPSFISGLLEQQDLTAEEMEHIRDSATGLYSGGADTTVAQLGFFFLAMTVFPEVQKRAREEIDRVTGGTRLPGFQDRDQLLYVEAVVKEALRWNPIAPMGLPHATDEEDTCRGYRIPKGSLIIPSIAWFTKDPDVYPEPDQFRPERFLGANPEPNPTAFVFGFGRRICPGRHLADANMFLVVAQSLAAFDISKAVDKSGNAIEPRIDFMPGVVGHPEPFQCRITPRSEKHAQWVRNIEIEQPWAEGDVALLQTMHQGL
ncbi:hypothetical protein PFICI_06251 [Pestalotiopsis fici W106-1]|uniref:O-methylsterigmatocystin oxidoreductase n=1 Tax=Pestalotiopsis fici (strain W106-1 / CGMCC3.15140) TaxID=1229662 RepID=W3X5H5_PESFW|nr:uncharacterized protein PFICI_06251 [Pestalotiopsis fici W106-1]ETS81249.1 hypothetical protein PFICI_06251 [Pestalotiopsis fici W106-1]